MSQGQQSVEGIFGVEVVVGPVAVKSPARIPQGVQKIEATLMNIASTRGGPWRPAHATLGGREEVRNRRAWNGEKAALRMEPARAASRQLPDLPETRGDG